MNLLNKLSFNGAKKLANSSKSTDENPYLNARRAWNGHVAGLTSALQIWQVVGITSLLISLASVGGMIYIGSQSKFIPLVFQQDSTGNTVSITRADRMPEATIEDYRTAVAQFIQNIRMVTVDADLQRKAVLHAYAFLNAQDPAALKANEYLNANNEVNPFSRAAHETVSIELRSVLRQSKKSWQVDWFETVRSRDGTPKTKPILMRAIVSIYHNPPTSETTDIEALRNPHFLYIRDFNWSKQI